MARRSIWAAALFFTVLSFLPGAARTSAHNLQNQPVDPLAQANHSLNVLLFVRTDCPLTRRYAPELGRIARKFHERGVAFWLVFSDRTETPAGIRAFLSEYQLPGVALLDPAHELVRLAAATVAPEAAVFDGKQQRLYLGRIDDLYTDFGKSRPAAQVHDLEGAIDAALRGQPVTPARTHAVGCALADVE